MPSTTHPKIIKDLLDECQLYQLGDNVAITPEASHRVARGIVGRVGEVINVSLPVSHPSGRLYFEEYPFLVKFTLHGLIATHRFAPKELRPATAADIPRQRPLHNLT